MELSYRNPSQARMGINVNQFVASVYNWMAIGLIITGGLAWFTANNEVMRQVIFQSPGVFWGLLIAELVMVFWLAARVQKMSASKATALFLVYSGLNGLTLSFIFMIYTATSISSTFFVCAATFLSASAYGWITKRDLTSFGGLMIMGLIGFIVASVVNFFVASSTLYWIITYAGVAIFVGLTAYDTQKMKNLAATQPADASEAVVKKMSIIMALNLYLDFINLFLLLLRILGDRR